MKAVNNISYAEAVKRVQGQKRKADMVNMVPRAEEGRIEENNAELSIDKLILFMAYVINCTDQVKHKTEKIKIIVRGAEKFLGMTGVSWEQINKRLEIDGKPGASSDKAI